MTSFGFQHYSVHAVDDPLATIIERVGEAGFDGIEFGGFDARVETIDDALTTAELDLAGAHLGLDELEDDITVVEQYAELGCEEIVVSWLDPAHFESEAAVEAVAERLSAVATELEAYDLALHYHNHDQEFVELGDGDSDEPALTRLIDATDDVGIELDLGWVGAAGYEPLSYLDEHADRVRLVHLKDYSAETGEPVEVGSGDLDVSATIESVRDHGFDWLIYEAEERPDSYETLDHAASIIEQHW